MLWKAIAAAAALCWAAPAATEPLTLEEAVLQQINHARANPQQVAEELREYRNWFEGELLFAPGDENGVITREGRAAVDEAIEFLERQAPLPPLDAGELLVRAARDHADERGALGGTGHVSRDGLTPGERVRRHGGNIFVGETISYGHDRADAIVRALIVDDGVPGRGHRKLLFDRGFRYAGVGCGAHARYRHICVVDLSGTETGEPALPASAAAAGARTFVYRPPQAQVARVDTAR